MKERKEYTNMNATTNIGDRIEVRGVIDNVGLLGNTCKVAERRGGRTTYETAKLGFLALGLWIHLR